MAGAAQPCDEVEDRPVAGPARIPSLRNAAREVGKPLAPSTPPSYQVVDIRRGCGHDRGYFTALSAVQYPRSRLGEAPATTRLVVMSPRPPPPSPLSHGSSSSPATRYSSPLSCSLLLLFVQSWHARAATTSPAMKDLMWKPPFCRPKKPSAGETAVSYFAWRVRSFHKSLVRRIAPVRFYIILREQGKFPTTSLLHV
jgi:hypothetical protein